MNNIAGDMSFECAFNALTNRSKNEKERERESVYAHPFIGTTSTKYTIRRLIGIDQSLIRLEYTPHKTIE